MDEKTYRCSNAALYGGVTLLVVMLCVYVAVRDAFAGYRSWLAVSAGCVCLLWGGYYVGLRFVVGASGVIRRTFVSSRRMAWEDLARVEVRDVRMSEVRSLSLTFVSASSRTIEMSSDLLSLEEMEALVEELRAQGRLEGGMEGEQGA